VIDCQHFQSVAIDRVKKPEWKAVERPSAHCSELENMGKAAGAYPRIGR